MGEELLSAHDVSFSYRPGGEAIIKDFSASFRAGTMSAIIGPSGGGKSTLLFLLGLMLVPTAGHVLVEGTSTGNMRDAERSRLRATKFGFVFQDSGLDPRRTVLDNVLQPMAFRGEAHGRWIAEARSFLERLGVTVPLDRRPGEVSGGQAQRIALCRALLTTPPIVLADEPTGNLDQASATVVTDALRACADHGAAVIIVTHSRDVEDACDRTITLQTVASQ